MFRGSIILCSYRHDPELEQVLVMKKVGIQQTPPLNPFIPLD